MNHKLNIIIENSEHPGQTASVGLHSIPDLSVE